MTRNQDYEIQKFTLQQKFNQNELDSSDLIDLIIVARKQRDTHKEAYVDRNTRYLELDMQHSTLKKQLRKILKNN